MNFVTYFEIQLVVDCQVRRFFMQNNFAVKAGGHFFQIQNQYLEIEQTDRHTQVWFKFYDEKSFRDSDMWADSPELMYIREKQGYKYDLI